MGTKTGSLIYLFSSGGLQMKFEVDSCSVVFFFKVGYKLLVLLNPLPRHWALWTKKQITLSQFSVKNIWLQSRKAIGPEKTSLHFWIASLRPGNCRASKAKQKLHSELSRNAPFGSKTFRQPCQGLDTHYSFTPCSKFKWEVKVSRSTLLKCFLCHYKESRSLLQVL